MVAVFCVEGLLGTWRVLALQPVLVKSLDFKVGLRETDRQTTIGFLHLLDQGTVRLASFSLCLATPTQTACRE